MRKPIGAGEGVAMNILLRLILRVIAMCLVTVIGAILVGVLAWAIVNMCTAHVFAAEAVGVIGFTSTLLLSLAAVFVFPLPEEK